MEIIIILRILWESKRQIIQNCSIALILAIIIAFSMPKEYTAEITLAPETSTNMSGMSSSLGAIASMAGINMSSFTDNEALYPDIYPEIVSSTPFLLEIADIQIETSDGAIKTNLYDYLKNHQSVPWWSYIISGPMKLIKNIIGEKEEKSIKTTNNAMQLIWLNREQVKLIEDLKSFIHVEIDKTFGLIYLKATMQDPLVATTLVQHVSDKLQKYVEQYRTLKARKDLEYIKQLYIESQKKYYTAQATFAKFVDSHQNLFFESTKAERDKLENEMSLAYNTYSQMAQQLELAKAKLQEKTPVCVELQPAVFPQKASSPRKLMIAFIFVFLSFFGTASWIVIKEKIIKGND